MPKTAPLKLVDDELQEAIDAAQDNTVVVDLFGEEFTITTEVNSWTLMKLTTGEPAAIVQFLQNVLVREADNPELTKDEREEARRRDEDNLKRFDEVLTRQRGLTPEVLMGIVTKLVAGVAERPTK